MEVPGRRFVDQRDCSPIRASQLRVKILVLEVRHALAQAVGIALPAMTANIKRLQMKSATGISLKYDRTSKP